MTKLKLSKYVRILALVTTTLTNFFANSVSAIEVEGFIARLKEHYQQTLPIKTFTLNHHYLNKQYRDQDYWDFQTPNRIMAQRVVQIDLEKQHFYDNDIYLTTGGRLLDRVHFQNDRESFAYEMNGTSLGKRVINQGVGQFHRMDYVLMNIDFLAVRPLLEESNIKDNIILIQDKDSGTTKVTHKTADNNIVQYQFNNSPLQLVSLNNKAKEAYFVYSDYQETRGLTFARTVYQHYDGATEPNYIIYNNQFDIIDKVDPQKLQLPPGYGPEIPASNGLLTSTKIAKDLYLISDSPGWRNSLFKINGNNITVFGASGYPTIAQKTINLIKEQFPDKKIKYVYVTHPHGHQIDGLKAFVEQGAEILADEYTIAGIKAYPPFTGSIKQFKFRPITHEQLIDDAQFYVLENLHVKRQSFVHFKESGIIFQAHFLHVPYDNTIAKVIPSYTRTFIDFVRKKQLKFNRIVSNYLNNNISVEVMNKTYDAIM